MKHTALLADDSLTIQKVIKITLAHEDFELTICQTDEQLLEKAKELKPNLILLDFSLSDNKSGYDLCSEVLKLSPNSKVLMLYGTFDTVDESAIKQCNASDKIIKPFDSVKFVSLCKSLMSEQSNSSTTISEGDSFSDSVESDDWTVDENSIVSNEEKKSLSIDQAKEEMNEWSNNGVILQKNETILESVGAIPPVISAPSSSVSLDLPEASSDITLPSSDDLEYPDFSTPSKPSAVESSKPGPSLQLQSMDELVMDDDDQPISLEEVIGTTSEEEVRKIEEEIADEINDDDLWSADESPKSVEDQFSLKDIKGRISANLKMPEKVLSFDEPEVKSYTAEQSAPASPAMPVSNSVDVDQIVDKVMAKLKIELDHKLSQMLEALVEKSCQGKVETIAWEVIPDLAENLIKTEIKRISDSVIDD